MIKANELNCTDYFKYFIERQERGIKSACENDIRRCHFYERDITVNGKRINFEEYRARIEREIESSGYRIVPTGYIGGVWQRTKSLVW